MKLEHVVQVSSCVLSFDVSVCDDVLLSVVDNELELLTDFYVHENLKGTAFWAECAIKLLAPGALHGAR